MNTVIVTGAAGALGSATSSYLEEQQWNVIRMDRATVDLTNVEQTAAYFRGLPHTPVALVHTVGGIIAGKPIQETDANDLHQNLAMNLLTTVSVVKAVMPLFINNGTGSIVTIGAQDVLHPKANRSLYAASKGAVVAFTRSIAEEGKPHGIRANVIVPSILRTASNMEWASEQEAENWLTPSEIAPTIGYLIQPNCHVNGAVLPVYGKVAF